jgi:hypothetical protein
MVYFPKHNLKGDRMTVQEQNEEDERRYAEQVRKYKEIVG